MLDFVSLEKPVIWIKQMMEGEVIRDGGGDSEMGVGWTKCAFYEKGAA